MTPLRFILASLRHFGRIHFTVVLGVAVATAVLTGALLVGDSVRGSLKALTLQRLGKVDSVLVTDHFFRAALADELAANENFKKDFTAAEPALLIPGTLQSGSGNEMRRATNISVIGCRPEFWSLGQNGPVTSLSEDQIAITESLARELGAKVGDEVLLRVGTAGALPADSTLGKKTETSRGRMFKVGAILLAKGLARFGLQPNQQLPRNAFVPLTALQELLKQPDKVNTILVATAYSDRAASGEAHERLQESLHPHLEDYGLRAERLTSPTECFQISAEQLVLPDGVVEAVEKAIPNVEWQPAVTYLANTIIAGSGENLRKIPYSTVTGIDSTATLGPLLDETGQPIVLIDDPKEKPEIVLNRWAADDLQAKVGDEITVNFYEPESTHGQLREHEPVVFQLKGIVELETADGKPTRAADPKLTPELPGVTDEKSIHDWDLPFELVEKIRPEDDEYWDKYRTTPKAFVSLATAKRLWPSRWGTISLLRRYVGESIGDSQPSENDLAEQIAGSLDPQTLGMTFQPVKAQGIAAATGTTPFQWLFLGFSFFLIAAAVMLIALLFQLGVEQRAAELGTLMAVGIDRRTVTRLLSREGLLVAVIGASIGVVAGIGYAWLMIKGLTTWWLAAISTPFLKLHISWPSLVIGWIAGVLVSWLTIRWSIRRMMRLPATRLLAGEASSVIPALRKKREGRSVLGTAALIVLVLVICGATALGLKLRGEAQAIAFFLTGSAVLTLLVIIIRRRLTATYGKTTTGRHFSLVSLAARNMARNVNRSTLTIGLVAAASFLILALSAFRLESDDAGTGGFALTATSDQPIYYDLNTAEGRRELGFSDDASQRLEPWRVYAMRVEEGEDASCLNLYQTKQPRVLGVPETLIERGGFEWTVTDSKIAGVESDKPWQLLNADLGHDADEQQIVPVVLDASTAIYSLHLGGVGAKYKIRDAANRPITLQVVGLLKNSVLQGNLLVSEPDFVRLFPDTAGYRFFLIEQSSGHALPATADATKEIPRNESSTTADSPPKTSATLDTNAVAQLLESSLADDGFDATDAREQLAGFLAVQNTYLSTFQSLGALGLLLGTMGLAIVQLRSVLERRGELALLRAAGFSPRRLVGMVILENCLLLLGGLAVGGVAAAIATMPQWAPHGASVPWATLVGLLGTVSAVGLIAGWLATRSALRAPILPALRGD